MHFAILKVYLLLILATLTHANHFYPKAMRQTFICAIALKNFAITIASRLINLFVTHYQAS